MVSALVLLSTLGQSPAQAPELKITNVHSRHGLHGPVRKESKVNVGDVAFLEFTIQGLKADDGGLATYTTAVEISNADGRVVFGQEPSKSTKALQFGGHEATAYFTSTIGPATPPGKYNVKVTVEDLSTKKKATLTRTVEVIKSDFALVRKSLSYDSEGAIPAPAQGVVGQAMQLNCHVLGAGRDKDGNPNLKATLQISEGGNPVKGAPTVGFVRKSPKDEQFIPLHLGMTLDRAGTFTVDLTVEDLVTKKSAKFSFDLTVDKLK